MLRALILSLMLPALAGAETLAFTPLQGPVTNPGRGWWTWIGGDFTRADEADFAALTGRAMTLGYAIVRLDDWRDRTLDAAVLARLEAAFARARAAGIKVILRFAYNYPESSTDFGLPPGIRPA